MDSTDYIPDSTSLHSAEVAGATQKLTHLRTVPAEQGSVLGKTVESAQPAQEEESHLRYELLEIQQFEAAFPVSSDAAADAMRRFSNLFVDVSSSRMYGANGCVIHAKNAFGEEFAVKLLQGSLGAGKTLNTFSSPVTESYKRAFRAEYENQRHLSNVKGFPRLFGYGMTGETPLIIMEWIEGINLSSLFAQYKDQATGHLDLHTVACLGAKLFSILANMQQLDSGPVHRDLSPHNVMIRTSNTPLEEQLRTGEFDLCIIDFGSMTVLDTYDPRLTTTTSILRRATPEYAPPEMLADSLPNIIELRQSPSIDVYAACSVLYELACGRTPFALATRTNEPPYQVKMSESPALLKVEDASFMPLTQALMKGLSQRQEDRPHAREIQAACTAVCGNAGYTPDLAGAEPPSDAPGQTLYTLTMENGGQALSPHATEAEAAPSVQRPPHKQLPRRKFVALAAGGIAAVALGSLGVVNFLNSSTTSSNTQSSASSKTGVPTLVKNLTTIYFDGRSAGESTSESTSEGGACYLTDASDGTTATRYPKVGSKVACKISTNDGYALYTFNITYTDLEINEEILYSMVDGGIERVSGYDNNTYVYEFETPNANDIYINVTWAKKEVLIHKQLQCGSGAISTGSSTSGGTCTMVTTQSGIEASEYPLAGSKAAFTVTSRTGYEVKALSVTYTDTAGEKVTMTLDDGLTRVGDYDTKSNTYEFTVPYAADVTINIQWGEKQA